MRCEADAWYVCYLREDGLPSPGFSAAEVVAGVVAAGAVGLLAPVHARHQRNLQQGSQHCAHDLHAQHTVSALPAHIADAARQVLRCMQGVLPSSL